MSQSLGTVLLRTRTMGTRVGPAALHAVQVVLLWIVVLTLDSVIMWLLLSILVPSVYLPLCSNEATQQRVFTHRLGAMMPFNLALGLVWLVYFGIVEFIQPFALLAYELLRLCLPSRRILPDDAQGGSLSALSSEAAAGSHRAPSSEAAVDEDPEQATGRIRRSNSGRFVTAAARAVRPDATARRCGCERVERARSDRHCAKTGVAERANGHAHGSVPLVPLLLHVAEGAADDRSEEREHERALRRRRAPRVARDQRGFGGAPQGAHTGA